MKVWSVTHEIFGKPADEQMLPVSSYDVWRLPQTAVARSDARKAIEGFREFGLLIFWSQEHAWPLIAFLREQRKPFAVEFRGKAIMVRNPQVKLKAAPQAVFRNLVRLIKRQPEIQSLEFLTLLGRQRCFELYDQWLLTPKEHKDFLLSVYDEILQEIRVGLNGKSEYTWLYERLPADQVKLIGDDMAMRNWQLGWLKVIEEKIVQPKA